MLKLKIRDSLVDFPPKNQEIGSFWTKTHIGQVNVQNLLLLSGGGGNRACGWLLLQLSSRWGCGLCCEDVRSSSAAAQPRIGVWWYERRHVPCTTLPVLCAPQSAWRRRRHVAAPLHAACRRYERRHGKRWWERTESSWRQTLFYSELLFVSP